MATEENKVQLDCLKYLRAKGFLCWRNGNHAVWDAKNNTYRSNPYNLPGVPDILCVDKEQYGQLIGIECKTKKGRPSANQLLCQKQFRLHNARYEFVTSLQDLKDLGF
jgi:hypothetical protein